MSPPTQAVDLSGRTALVTGANSGVGWWTAAHLATAGARVVLACRSETKARAAIAELSEAVATGVFDFVQLDLADLASVRSASEQLLSRYERLDILVNNAGVAMVPLARTADGFEMHFGANFLGHFALTGLLIDRLLETPGSRIVQVGSLAHRVGKISFDDPNYERRRYSKLGAYAQSKVASLLFLAELDRRLGAIGSTTVSAGAHPGISMTSIADSMWIARIPGIRPAATRVEGSILNLPSKAAEISVHAATSPDARGGDYFGPAGRFELSGGPKQARLAGRVKSDADAEQLWALAERLTGVSFLD